MLIFRYLKTTKNKIYLWLSYILFSTLIPLSSAQAIPGLDILTAPFVFLAKLVTALAILAALSWGFLSLAQVILNWAANPSLVGNVTTNQFVLAGWSIIRDFSNLFFILILVAIGIATALRIKSYEVKKTLPRLIVAAILINFSPVICGVIIDVANILMNFFMTAGAAGYGDALSLAQSGGNALITILRGSIGDWSGIFTGVIFVKIIIAIAFNFFAAFVLIMFSVLFLMRNLMLWILVIFSPFAFVSAILPASKKNIYDWWIKNFLQWTFIGIAGAFFIYLSQLMLELGVHSLLTNSPSTDASAFGGKTISNFIVLTIPFIFLLVGYSVTLSFAPMGASGIMNMAKSATGWTKKKGTAAAKNRLANLRDSAIEKAVPEGMKNKMADWAKATKNPKDGRFKQVVKSPVNWAKRRVGKNVNKVIGKDKIESIEKEAEKSIENVSVDTILSEFRDTKNQTKKLGYLNHLVKNNMLDDAMDAGLDPSEMESVFEFAQKQGRDMEKDIFSAAPHLAKNFIKPTKPGQTQKQAYEDFIAKIGEKRAARVSTRSLNDPDTTDIMVKKWTGKNFGKLLSEGGPEVAEKIEDSVIRLAGATHPSLSPADRKGLTDAWLKKHNPALFKYKNGNNSYYFNRI